MTDELYMGIEEKGYQALSEMEAGSAAWITMVNSMVELKKLKTEKPKEEKFQWKYWLTKLGEACIGIAVATIPGLIIARQQAETDLQNIDEISRFEKDDAYTGKKASYLPKKK